MKKLLVSALTMPGLSTSKRTAPSTSTSTRATRASSRPATEMSNGGVSTWGTAGSGSASETEGAVVSATTPTTLTGRSGAGVSLPASSTASAENDSELPARPTGTTNGKLHGAA